ncbi:hypothetical protein FRC09_008407 [Ceratobasidium sp. 395]|nr:hypothetical protein FRC09_008407 [Ceratobasidium sp. 395]
MPWLKPGLDLECRRRLDGVNLGNTITRTGIIKEGADTTIRGHHNSPSTLRLFCFGKRILTDREDVAPSGPPRDDLNTIRLIFRWGRAGKRVTKTNFVRFRENGPIHEKAAKKGHAGSAGLGSSTSIDYKPQTTTFEPTTGLESVTFTFRYAPEDWLQARGIISPENPSQKRENSTTPDVIDIDDLESEDDHDVMIVKHLIPAPVAPSMKRQKIKDEDDVKPKLEL